MKLPLLISVPHAGLAVPPEVEAINLLTPEQIAEDGDEGAGEIFALADEVAAFLTTEIARAFVDMNRSEHDRSADGVVKTETIYKQPVYRQPLTPEQVNELLANYHRPYHSELARLSSAARLGIDCHTMAALAPPICADAGAVRPDICLSDGDGACPRDWLDRMADCLAESFGREVSLNQPFKGGHIIRSHAGELPWMQLEISRASFMPIEEKQERVRRAFELWLRRTA